MNAYKTNSAVGAPAVGRALAEYSPVKLNTCEYESRGLREGEIGTVVDVLDYPRRGYTVEFHDVASHNANKVRTFESHEIALA